MVQRGVSGHSGAAGPGEALMGTELPVHNHSYANWAVKVC
jgi:hypothetical protein